MMTMTSTDPLLPLPPMIVHNGRVDFSPEASVTEHPVEFGAVITDHVQKRPTRFTVEVPVTNTPMLTSLSPFNVEAVRTFLETVVGHPMTVLIDGEGTFPNCVLEAFPHARTAEGGRAFACRFRQIRIASAISVPIPARLPAPVAATGAATEAPLGVQPVAPVPPSLLFDFRALMSPLF